MNAPAFSACELLEPMHEITRILSTMPRNDTQASDQLLPLVYDELHRLAAQQLAREKPGLTLQPSDLVHEAYIRLVDTDSIECWDNRGHFFAAAAEAMRRILVENARRKARQKHGGGRRREHAELDNFSIGGSPQELLDLHEALEQFALQDPIKAKLVELRFFGGLTMLQAASCLNISLSSADRAWRYARAWLYAAMAGAESPQEKLSPV
jgi:RNA polymerase sigma factor (TIGR02999 family)